jgi:hypothetical protein
MFVYSAEMVHYSDDMFHRTDQEELIMSDEEDDYLMQNLHLISASHLIQEIELPQQPPRPSHPPLTLPSPFDVSNEEFMSINLSQAMASVTEENYRREQIERMSTEARERISAANERTSTAIERMSAAYEGISLRDYIERNREYIGRNTWLESPTTVCDVEDMEPPMVSINLDIYGFSEDEIDNMEAQNRRYEDREARLNYYTSSDEGIPESAFDDTSSVGSINYDSDDDSVLQERYYDEWEESIKWEVEDKTDPDEHPFIPQKKDKTNKETKTKFTREQRKQAAVLSVKEQTERELTKREQKEIAKFHKSSNIQSSKFSKIKKSKEIQRQRTAKYAQLTQSHSTLKEELYDMYLHNKYNQKQKDEKTAAEIENAIKRKHEKREQVFLIDEWRSLKEFKAYERMFIQHMDTQGIKMSRNDLHFKRPSSWPYRYSPLHTAHSLTYIPRKIRRPGQELLTDKFWTSPNFDYFIHKPKK